MTFLPSSQSHPSHSLLSSLDTFACQPSSSTAPAAAARRSLRCSPSWTRKLDVVQQLGGEGAEGYGDNLGIYGHTGCINALNWSSDGTLLASGSDDTRVCLWKLGHEPDYEHPRNKDIVHSYSSLGFGLSASIQTGHRANIFSVKFSPVRNSHIYTAAGDHEVRVFDLAIESATSNAVHSSASRGREFTEYPKPSGVCTRVLKCHRGRVKRIATEDGSDCTFLTCSEDGTVRQHDLRVGHTCGPLRCPPPLCNYRDQGLGLYSLSTSPLRPELFVVAGTSPYAFLHDRRMIPRTMLEEWGIPLRAGQLTQCVRRFGPTVPPLVPASEADELTSESEAEEEKGLIGPITAEEQERRRQRRVAQRHRAMTRRRRSRADHHVTAAKLSSANSRELLLTYSGGPVCLYDIFDDPERDESKTMSCSKGGRNVQNMDESKRGKLTNVGPESPQGLTGSRSPNEEQEDSLHTRRHSVAPMKNRDTATEGEQSTEATADPPSVGSGANQSDFVTRSLADESSLQRQAEGDVYIPAAPEGRLSETGPSSPVPGSEGPPRPRPRQREFEIRVGEDGDLEMDVHEAEQLPLAAADEDEGEDAMSSASSGSTDAERREAYGDGFLEQMRSLGRGQSARRAANESEREAEVAMGDTSTDDDDEDSEEIGDLDDEDEDEDEEDEDEDEDGISESDSMPSQPEEGSVQAGSEIPLVRPRSIFTGHRNVDTVKDVNFGGGDDSLVLSGSDDGNLFIWAKESGELLGIWEGDSSVVNVLQWHPHLPVLAVSGIDNSVKILAPTGRDEKWASRLQKRREIERKNKDASWSSQGLSIPPNVLLSLFARAQGEGGGEGAEEGDEGGPTRRRIPLQTLLRLAQEGGDEDENCRIM